MARLLIVDDEDALRRALRRTLQDGGHTVAEASSVSDARAVLASEEIELVLCDINMPGGSGLELVRAVAGNGMDTAVVMLTGVDDPTVAEEALAIGAYGYLVKPIERNEALINVASGLRRRELEIGRRQHVQELEDKLMGRGAALRDALHRLEESETEVVDYLVGALTLRSEETGAHIRRVSAYSALLAGKCGSDLGVEEEIRSAAALHDVGKIGIPDSILLKPGPLSDEEFRIIKRHPSLGNSMLADGKSRALRLGAEIALAHHERWDGTGYPNGLAGENIPIGGRIVAVADVFDALTSDRVYRRAMPVEQAAEEMTADRGQHFEPALLDLFIASIDEVEAIRSGYPEQPPRSPSTITARD